MQIFRNIVDLNIPKTSDLGEEIKSTWKYMCEFILHMQTASVTVSPQCLLNLILHKMTE